MEHVCLLESHRGHTNVRRIECYPIINSLKLLSFTFVASLKFSRSWGTEYGTPQVRSNSYCLPMLVSRGTIILHTILQQWPPTPIFLCSLPGCVTSMRATHAIDSATLPWYTQHFTSFFSSKQCGQSWFLVVNGVVTPCTPFPSPRRKQRNGITHCSTPQNREQYSSRLQSSQIVKWHCHSPITCSTPSSFATNLRWVATLSRHCATGPGYKAQRKNMMWYW